MEGGGGGQSSTGMRVRELDEVVRPAVEAVEDVRAEDHRHATLGALACQPAQQPAAPHDVEAVGAGVEDEAGVVEEELG